MSVTNVKKGLKVKLILNKILIFLGVIFASMLTELAIVFLSSKCPNMPREVITIISLALVVFVSLVVSVLSNRHASIKVVTTNVVAPFGGLVISMVDYFLKETAEEFMDSIVADVIYERIFINVSPIVGGWIILAIMFLTFGLVYVLQRREIKLEDIHLMSYENYAESKEFEQKIDRIKSGFVKASLIITLVALFAWFGIVISGLI